MKKGKGISKKISEGKSQSIGYVKAPTFPEHFKTVLNYVKFVLISSLFDFTVYKKCVNISIFNH